jgi:hypothetical protein
MKTVDVTFTDDSTGYYSLGLKIGTELKLHLEKWVPLDEELNCLLKFVEESEIAREVLSRFEQIGQECYPNVFAELSGLSTGSGFPFATVLVSNHRKELFVLRNSLLTGTGTVCISPETEQKGCSDVHGRNHSFKGWAHNEDYSWSMWDRPGFLIRASRQCITSANCTAFVAYAYPLCLPGMTVFANSHGVVSTINSRYPSIFIDPRTAACASSQVISRYAMESESVSEFIARVTTNLNSTGRGYSVASVHEPDGVHYIEVGPGGKHAVIGLPPTPSFQANSYIYLRGVPEIGGPSSVHRLNRFDQMKSSIQSFPADLLNVMGDEEDSEWPIYRTGKPPDRSVTQFTCLVNLGERKLSFYTERPGPETSVAFEHYL